MCAVMRTGFTDGERRAGLGEQVPDDERRVAHHVVEHAAALQSPCQNHGMCGPLCSSAARARYGRPVVAAPRAQSSSRPGFDLRREELVLEVAVLEPDALHQLGDLLRLGDVARERLLAGDAVQRPAPALDRVDDLLDVLDARLVRPA